MRNVFMKSRRQHARPLHRSGDKCRDAFTLIEMVLTFSAGSSLLLLAVSLVSQSMSLSKSSMRRAEKDRFMARLEHDFREDVHMATSAEVNEVGSLLLQRSDDLQVTYRFSDDRILRECRAATDKDQPANAAGDATSDAALMSEDYRLESGSTALFSVLSMPARAELSVERRLPGTGEEKRVDSHVVALVGKWQRLESSQGQSP